MNKKLVPLFILPILLMSGCFDKDCEDLNYDYKTKISNTGSMLPTLNENMNLYFKIPKSEQEIKINDIIHFKNDVPWNLYTGASDRIHRVIGITEDGYITKGDNEKEQDSGFRKFEDIKGVLICKK